jgi:hypothetical protein
MKISSPTRPYPTTTMSRCRPTVCTRSTKRATATSCASAPRRCRAGVLISDLLVNDDKTVRPWPTHPGAPHPQAPQWRKRTAVATTPRSIGERGARNMPPFGVAAGRRYGDDDILSGTR